MSGVATEVFRAINDEEYEIFSRIAERISPGKGLWKLCGMYGLTKFEILFLAQLRGFIKPKEMKRLKEIHAAERKRLENGGEL